MLKSLKVMAIALAATVLSAATSQATFNFFVQSTGGPAFASYNSAATSNTIELLSGGVNPPFSVPGLTMSYSVTNSPGTGQFILNNLTFVYLGNPTPISLQVVISENAANFIGAGAPLTGFASFSANGNVASSFSNTTTFTPGVGANSINFPLQNFTGSPTVSNGSTSFVSGGAVGTIQSVFNINITPNSNVSFTAGGGFGAFGVADATLVPAPPAVLLGLAGIPLLGLIRRRMKK